MTGAGDERLHRLLGGNELAGLRQRLRRRFEQAASEEPADTLRLSGLLALEREALAALTGQPARRSSSIVLDLPAIDAALLRAGIAASLREALERLDGPIVHRATARAARDALWTTVASGAQSPALAALLAMPEGLGLLKRLARQDADHATQLRSAADAVLSRLPGGGVTRAQLAAETLGDAHGLDGGRPVATLVLAARRGQTDGDDTPERRRAQWARAGVLVNELARPALFLNLPAAPRLAPAGEPGYASLRLLLRTPPQWQVDGRNVYVTENPNVVAIAADRLGPRCAPLVCTDGMPAAAQRTLLAQLTASGARLRYHGDFDWPGLTIGNVVLGSFGASPWRFGAADYEAALPLLPERGQPLAGAAVEATWDAALAPAMQKRGLAVAEEGIAEVLITDLAQPADMP